MDKTCALIPDDASRHPIEVPWPKSVCDDAVPVVIGRDRKLEEEFRFQKAKLSSRHCSVHVDPLSERMVLTDLSKNGTFVNGVNIGEGLLSSKTATLQEGDRIALLHPTKHDASDNVELTATYKQTVIQARKAAVADDSTESSQQSGAGAVQKKRPLEAPGSPVQPPTKLAKTTQGEAAVHENLTCAICHEIMYRPMSLLPCLHTFCGPCLQQWLSSKNLIMKQHPGDSARLSPKAECPTCRGPVQTIKKNHAMQGAVDGWAVAHPELNRSVSNLAALDATSQGKLDSLEGLRVAALPPADGSWSSDHYDEEDEEDDEDYSDGVAPTCPECTQPNPVDQYKCPAGASWGHHASCAKCGTLIPKRPELRGTPRQQSCSVCCQYRCEPYYSACQAQAGGPWGAGGGFDFASPAAPVTAEPLHRDSAGVRGLRGLAPLGEIIPTALPAGRDLFGGNAAEQKILGDWLAAAHKNVDADVWQACLSKLSTGEWIPRHPHVQQRLTMPLTKDTIVCGTCFSAIFGSLLLDFRITIDPAELPAEVVSRQNCWYGFGCRTQYHKPPHAEKLNHACLPAPPPPKAT
ncbi:FHA domain containing protein [Diplonema papillatum]|nr:FHA domain containing protein [Diplonema papillatum]|eukprot:gene13073-20164_t